MISLARVAFWIIERHQEEFIEVKAFSLQRDDIKVP
jgi:hypothetical protein